MDTQDPVTRCSLCFIFPLPKALTSFQNSCLVLAPKLEPTPSHTSWPPSHHEALCQLTISAGPCHCEVSSWSCHLVLEQACYNHRWQWVQPGPRDAEVYWTPGQEWQHRHQPDSPTHTQYITKCFWTIPTSLRAFNAPSLCTGGG